MKINSPMKLMLSLLGVTMALSTQAATYFQAPYLGATVLQTNQKFDNKYAGNKVFAENPLHYGVMAGFRFGSIFGFEAGYELMPTTDKRYYFGPGEIDYAGVVVDTYETVSVISSYRAKHPYVGITARYVTPITIGIDKLSLEAFIGASFSKVTASTKIHVVNDAPQSLEFFKNYSKKYIAPMLRLTTMANLTSYLGIGLSVQYRNMSGFRLTSAPAPAPNATRFTIKMKDMFAIGLALRLNF